MISNFLVETFGKTTYITFVITERANDIKLEFLPRVSRNLKSVFRSAGREFYAVASRNHKEIESIVINDVEYYFSVKRIRHNENIHYGIYVLYAISLKNKFLIGDKELTDLLFGTSNDRIFDDMSEASKRVLDGVRGDTEICEYVYDFLGNALDGFFENNKERYFYKINDVIKYTIDNYFSEDICPKRVVANYINSNMYTQMNLNSFMFFMINLFLVIIKYLKGTAEINFKNNIDTLDTVIGGRFTDGFFENNEDIIRGDECMLSSAHPAFSDFEFVKGLANRVGASVNMVNPSKNDFEIRISVSKIDLVFSNILRVTDMESANSDIPVYTADISGIIN